jgi:hypothetical protein
MRAGLVELPGPVLGVLDAYLDPATRDSLAFAGVGTQAHFMPGGGDTILQRRLQDRLQGLRLMEQELMQDQEALWMRLRVHDALERETEEAEVLRNRLQDVRSAMDLARRELRDLAHSRGHLRRAREAPFGVSRRDSHLAFLNQILDTAFFPCALVRVGPLPGGIIPDGAAASDPGGIGDIVRAWWPAWLPAVTLRQLRRNPPLFRDLRQCLSQHLALFQPFILTSVHLAGSPDSYAAAGTVDAQVGLLMFLMLALPWTEPLVVSARLVQFARQRGPRLPFAILERMVPDLIAEAADMETP